MILSFDSSAVTASAALSDGSVILKSEFENTGLTHSETLLPMIKRVMGDTPYSELEAIALTAGPGSFTGVRIGVATAKGLAFKYGTPCVSVSTLEAIAYNFIDENCTVCAVMDARRLQFYNALFEVQNGVVTRLTPDRTISLEDLKKDLEGKKNVVISGDGAQLCYNNLGLDTCRLAEYEKRYQNAASVARAAENKKRIPAFELMPVYLRQSQAERELKLKKENKK